MLVALYETELLGLEMATDRVGALPSPLLQKDGDSTSILKNRVVECPDIWAPGVHPMIADRTICRFTSLAYHDLNRRWRRLGDVGYNISVFEAK